MTEPSTNEPAGGPGTETAGGPGPGLEIVPIVPRLSDGAVVLRAPVEADVDALTVNCLDAAAVRWTTIPLDYTPEMARDFIHAHVPSKWREGTGHNFAVADASTDALLGTIGLHRMHPGSAEVGINMGPAARGTGASTRAVRLVLDYAFNHLNLRYLFWKALVPNWASRKLAWKNGFREPAMLRGYCSDRGEPADTWILSLAADESWEPAGPWDGPASPAP